jgi:Family of unknown function (DUF6114)
MSRSGFAAWRGRRPFWGGTLLCLGGAEILLTERAPLPVVLHIGMEGVAGFLLPVMMLICGLLTLFNPAQRLFYAVVSVLLSLGSWITSNMGGFFIGLLMGVIGSCMVFGWLPDQEPRVRRRDRKKQRQAAAQDQGPGISAAS